MKNTLLILFTSLFAFIKAQTGLSTVESYGADAGIQHFMRTWNIHGGSVAITKDGKLVYNKSFGYSDVDKKQPARPSDLYRVASISKPVTAVAIMKLVEDGKLRLDDKVFGENRIITDAYYTEGITDRRVYDITVRHLLEHTAGWDRTRTTESYSHFDPPFFPLYVTEVEDAPNPVGDSTLIRFTLRNGVHYRPGTVYAYSNIGYLILGKVIEKISGTSYESFVKTNIFHPISAYDMELGKNLPQDKHEREVDYICSASSISCYGDGSYVPMQYGGFNLEAMNAHGGWIGTASDLTRFVLAVDGFDTYPDLLSKASVSEMKEGSYANPGYAKGWVVNERDNWWHTGSLDGTAAMVARTHNGYTWAFLFNGRGDNSAAFWRMFDALPWTVLKSLEVDEDMNLSAPTVNTSNLTAQVVRPGTVMLKWENGNGDNRLIVVSESQAAEFPADGEEYTADAAYGEGSLLGNGSFVVYNGNAKAAMVTNLDPVKNYYFTAFEYNRNDETGLMEVYKAANYAKFMLMPTRKVVAGRMP